MKSTYPVEMHRAFRYRFYPTPNQEQQLRQTFGCVRLIYNRALQERSEAWVNEKKSISYATQSRSLTQLKRDPEFAFLNEVSAAALQMPLRHLQQAYENFFAKRARYPRFKRRKYGGSATFARNGFIWRNGSVILAKMREPLAIRWSRPLPESVEPSSVTVSVDAAGRWHASLLCEDSTIRPLRKCKEAVGVDVGLNALVTLSTGEKIANPRHDARELARKRILSRRLARKEKGTKNRDKARLKLARLHARVADRRRDNLHKLTTRLVRDNQTIVVEDLNVRGMVQNRCLARAISDASWAELVWQLEYKCEWYGRELVKVDRFFPSSKTCSNCGAIREGLRLNERTWTCKSCNAKHDRDHNAAKNILAAGHAVTACGPDVSHGVLRDSVRLGLKQESSVARPKISSH